jgi:DNA recombination protein RmuC
VSDLEKIGSGIDASRKNYDAAMNKLKDGQGNLIRSAEKLKELGAKTNKELSKNRVE